MRRPFGELVDRHGLDRHQRLVVALGNNRVLVEDIDKGAVGRTVTQLPHRLVVPYFGAQIGLRWLVRPVMECTQAGAQITANAYWQIPISGEGE